MLILHFHFHFSFKFLSLFMFVPPTFWVLFNFHFSPTDATAALFVN